MIAIKKQYDTKQYCSLKGIIYPYIRLAINYIILTLDKL